MKINIKPIALSAALLVSAHVLFGQSYLRPVSLPEGATSKTIHVIEYKDGTRTVLEKDDFASPNGEVKDTSTFVLVDGMLLETTQKTSGDMKLGNVILPLDGVKFGTVAVSDPKKRIEFTEDKEPLNASVKCLKTVFKYKDTLNLAPALKDKVVRVENRVLVRCGQENDPGFQVIVNGNMLLPELMKAGVEHDVTSALETLELSDPDKIKTVTFVPIGHVPTFVTGVEHVDAESRSELPPVDPSTPWLWIIIGAGVLLAGAIAAILLMARRKRKKKEISSLKSKDEEEKEDSEKIIHESAESRIAAARKEERLKLEAEIGRLKNKVVDLQDSLRKEKDDVEKRLEEARETERRKSEKEIERLKEDNKELEDKIIGLKDNLKKEKEEAEKTLNQEREQARQQVAAAHREEKEIAEQEISALKASHLAEVTRLEDEQRIYSEKIAFVPFASQYARDVYSLINTVNEINQQAKELAKVEVEDPYLIFKAISKFNLAQSEIDYEGLLLDVSLAAKNDMSFAKSGIANLKTVSQDQMFSSLRNYFLSAYLEKYIDAAVVYNESLAGIDRLVEGIDASLTAPFKSFRDKLKECCKHLGIAVISVKLFDTLGDNIDLKATMVDFDDRLPADSIIAIENCLVYPEGGRRPMEKIFVKAQK
jgi:hypothetical protein